MIMRYAHLAFEALAHLLNIKEDIIMDIILDAGKDYINSRFGCASTPYRDALYTSPEFWKWWMNIVNNRCGYLIEEITITFGACYFNQAEITDPEHWLKHMFRPAFINYWPNDQVVNAVLERMKVVA